MEGAIVLNDAEREAIDPVISFSRELAAICLRKYEAELNSLDYYARSRARRKLKEAFSMFYTFVDRIWEQQDLDLENAEREQRIKQQDLASEGPSVGS